MAITAILLTAAPFVFGALRLATTGEDARYLWTAVASTCGAAAFLWRQSVRAPVGGWRVGFAGISAASSAAAAAVVVGARHAGAVAMVAVAFAACSTLGLALLARARRQAWTRRESGR